MRAFYSKENSVELDDTSGSLIEVLTLGLTQGTQSKAAPGWIKTSISTYEVSFNIPETQVVLKLDDSNSNFSVLYFLKDDKELKIWQNVTLKKGATQWALYCDVTKFYLICDYSNELDWSDIRCYFFGSLKLNGTLHYEIYGLIADFNDVNLFFTYVSDLNTPQFGNILDKGFFTTTPVHFSKTLTSALINVLLYPNISDGVVYLSNIAVGHSSVILGFLPDFYVLDNFLVLEKPERICVSGSKRFSKPGVICLDLYQMDNKRYGFSVEM